MIKPLFKPHSQTTTGLDIGNSSLKVVQLRTLARDEGREITSFDIKPLASQERAVLVKSICASMEEANIAGKYVNISVSGQAIIVRYLQMPRMTPQELRKAVLLNIGKYIPFSAAEVNYDVQILGQPDKNEKTMRVLLVAAKKDYIEERVAILREAGLEPNIIDVDSFAVVNSFQLLKQAAAGVIAVVDVGADVTCLTILKDNVPQFNRDVLIGGSHFSKVIMEEFEVSEAQAEELKHNPQDRYGDLINALRPTFDRLCSEIHLSFNYCEGQLGEPVSKMYLTGGTAKFKGIDKVLNSILGIDIEIWDPTRALKIGSTVDKERLTHVGPLLTVAVGLALRE